ncbi:iris-like [Amblyomma americanum]
MAQLNPPAHGQPSASPDYSQLSTGTPGAAGVHSHSLGNCLICFAVDLFKQLAPACTVKDGSLGASSGTSCAARGNLVFSPFGVAAALPMTLAGALSDTAGELASALHFCEGSQIHDQFTAELAHIVSGVLRVTFGLSNRLYSDQRFSRRCDAVRAVDFAGGHEAVRAEANQCVERETADRVRDLLKEVSVGPAIVLALVSAAYTSWDRGSRAAGMHPVIVTDSHTHIMAALFQDHM